MPAWIFIISAAKLGFLPTIITMVTANPYSTRLRNWHYLMMKNGVKVSSLLNPLPPLCMACVPPVSMATRKQSITQDEGNWKHGDGAFLFWCIHIAWKRVAATHYSTSTHDAPGCLICQRPLHLPFPLLHCDFFWKAPDIPNKPASASPPYLHARSHLWALSWCSLFVCCFQSPSDMKPLFNRRCAWPKFSVDR